MLIFGKSLKRPAKLMHLVNICINSKVKNITENKIIYKNNQKCSKTHLWIHIER